MSSKIEQIYMIISVIDGDEAFSFYKDESGIVRPLICGENMIESMLKVANQLFIPNNTKFLLIEFSERKILKTIEPVYD